MSGLAPIAVGTSPYELADVKTPDAISWGLQDISSADAGRTQDAGNTMQKMRVSQKRKLQLSWSDPTLEEASAILTAFNPEYVHVRYVDVMAGGYEVREFYVGDRSSPFREIRNPVTGTVMSTLSFDIIER